MYPTHSNRNANARQVASEENLDIIGRRQDDFSRTTVEHLRSSAQQIWQESDAAGDVRALRNSGLRNLLVEADRGGEMLYQVRDACFAAERDRQTQSELFMRTRMQIGNTAMAALMQSMTGFIAKSSADMAAGRYEESTTTIFDAQTRAIDDNTRLAMDLQMLHVQNQNEFAVSQRENLAADATLFLDILERSIRIKNIALQAVSDEFRKECELKFRTIEKAIRYVKVVQESMQSYASMAEEQKDRDSARRAQEMQRVEAEKRAMVSLDMSHDEARRAAALLDKKESHLYMLKREELAMQKCRDQQEHERRTKRYFSVWGWLFG